MYVHYIEILNRILNGIKFFTHNLLDIGNSDCLTVAEIFFYFLSSRSFWNKIQHFGENKRFNPT
jgi:hypothetical protein